MRSLSFFGGLVVSLFWGFWVLDFTGLGFMGLGCRGVETLGLYSLEFIGARKIPKHRPRRFRV